MQREQVAKLLHESHVGGLTDVVCEGIDNLQIQGASTGFNLNTKFKNEGKFDGYIFVRARKPKSSRGGREPLYDCLPSNRNDPSSKVVCKYATYIYTPLGI